MRRTALTRAFDAHGDKSGKLKLLLADAFDVYPAIERPLIYE